MHFRPLVAALVAATLFACGPQNIVEDTGGVPESDVGSTRDEARSGGSASKPPSAIPMKVQTSAELGGAFVTTFSVYSTYDVYFALDLPSSKKGSHLARYEVRSPNGLVYQVNEVQVAAGIAPSSGQVSADIISGGYRVWSSLPVAGTMIQQLNMTGRWSVKAFLDGAQVASATFTLNP